MADRLPVPGYFIYGEPTRRLDPGFIHVETISARKSLHRGRVEAHNHPDMGQLTLWIKGGGQYSIEDRTWIFSAPALAWIPSGAVHGFTVSAKSDAIVLSVADRTVEAADALGTEAVFLNPRHRNETWAALNSVLSLLQKEHARSALPVMVHLAGAALALTARLKLEHGASSSAQPAALALKLRQSIDANFRRDWSVADYARSLGTTYHLLDRAAREGFGAPVKKLITARRILEAKRLLKFTIRAAEDIAYEVGYADPAYFSRAFKTAEGMAPGLWRRERG